MVLWDYMATSFAKLSTISEQALDAKSSTSFRCDPQNWWSIQGTYQSCEKKWLSYFQNLNLLELARSYRISSHCSTHKKEMYDIHRKFEQDGNMEIVAQ